MMLQRARDGLLAIETETITTFADAHEPERSTEPGRSMLAVLGLVRDFDSIYL